MRSAPQEHPDRDRVRRRRHQPSILFVAGELRPALESPARRAADRPLPSLRPEDRRDRREFHQRQEPGRAAHLPAPRPEIPAVRRRVRCQRRGVGRDRERRRFRAPGAGDRAVRPLRDRDQRGVRPATDGLADRHRHRRARCSQAAAGPRGRGRGAAAEDAEGHARRCHGRVRAAAADRCPGRAARRALSSRSTPTVRP